MERESLLLHEVSLPYFLGQDPDTGASAHHAYLSTACDHEWL